MASSSAPGPSGCSQCRRAQPGARLCPSPGCGSLPPSPPGCRDLVLPLRQRRTAPRAHAQCGAAALGKKLGPGRGPSGGPTGGAPLVLRGHPEAQGAWLQLPAASGSTASLTPAPGWHGPSCAEGELRGQPEATCRSGRCEGLALVQSAALSESRGAGTPAGATAHRVLAEPACCLADAAQGLRERRLRATRAEARTCLGRRSPHPGAWSPSRSHSTSRAAATSRLGWPCSRLPGRGTGRALRGAAQLSCARSFWAPSWDRSPQALLGEGPGQRLGPQRGQPLAAAGPGPSDTCARLHYSSGSHLPNAVTL